MKLRTKLILSFSVVVLLVGGIGLASSFVSESVKNQVTTESQIAINEIELAGELGLQLYQSLTRTQYLLEDQYRQSLPSDASGKDLTKERVTREIDRALRNFEAGVRKAKDTFRQNLSESTKDSIPSTQIILQLDTLETKFGIYVSLIEELKTLSTEDYSDAKEFFTVTIEPYFRTSLLPLIESLRTDIEANHKAKVAELNDRLNTISFWLAIATILALGITVSITFFLYRSIANPLNKIADGAQEIGSGNLDKRISYESQDELGQLSQTFNSMAESLSQTTVSRDFVDSIIKSMADLLIVTDEKYKISRINSAGLRMLNMKEENVIGIPVDQIFKENRISLVGNGTGKGTERNPAQNASLLQNDHEIPVSLSKGAIKTKAGEVEGYVFVASDISSEREAQQNLTKSLKEKQVLLAEIHHRVKNNLAVISGLLQMQMWKAENEVAATALQESQMRVQSIALIHEKLYQTENLSYIQFDSYIRELLEAINSTYIQEEGNIQIRTDLEEVILNVNQAIPCSLLLNELVTNALKHAFSNQKKGTVLVKTTQTADYIKLIVKDNGKGFPDNTSDFNTLGMSLIKTLSKQLKGDLEFNNENGAEITVTFQLEEVTAD